MQNSEPPRVGRKRVLPPCPNPLFLKWLTELRDDAKEKGLKTQHTYQKAINSLKKYPLPLQNAKEAKILQNFGDGICKILDEKLQRHQRQNGPDAPIHSLPKIAPPSGRVDNNSLAPRKKKNVPEDGGTEVGAAARGGRKNRQYVPQRRSGGYAVLITLYRQSQIPGYKGFMFKMELQAEAQALCDKSFTMPDLGSKYTAWSSVSTLIKKNLVTKTHNPVRYSLTEEGSALAEQLESVEKLTDDGAAPERDSNCERGAAMRQQREEEETEEGVNEVVDLTGGEEEEGSESGAETSNPAECREMRTQEDRTSPTPTASNTNRWRLLPGSYDIVLCVDFIETTGGSHHSKQELVKELQRNGVNFHIRKLNVGDFLWVAREKVEPIPGQLRPPEARELVLDHIIERKRMDDLCGSIVDGRFREQKFRLRRCGLRRPIYLVEEHGSAAAHLSLPEASLQQAIINTQIVDGFFVKRVQDVRESAAYLTIMTRQLTKLYQNRTLFCRSRELEGDGGTDEETRGTPPCSLISFTEFNDGAMKNKCQTVRDVFAKQLMQIGGLSGDKAVAILEQYSTPCSLLTAYEQCSSEAEKEKLLSSIRFGKSKRNIGPVLSRTVYQLYCTTGPLS